jgi:hypothetical protein
MNSLAKKSEGKRRRVMFTAATVVLGLAAGATTLFAVHDDTPPPQLFELDGNAVDAALVPGDDWDTVVPTNNGSADTSTFLTDPTGDDESTHFKGGDKDTQDIPDWDIVTQDDTPKDDIEHAFAAAYTNDEGDLVIYAGDDRFATAGSASHGFWFFKNKITVPLGSSKFSGVHADGDILVAVEFQQGGSKAVINVFRWETQPVGNASNLQLVFSGTTNVTPGVPFCNAAQGNIPADVVCGITNNVAVSSPWLYHSSSGDPLTDEDFPPQSFFELGINVTKLVGETCFASFLASSRSSATETATIKDFAIGGFDVCAVEVGKACTATPVIVDGKLRTTFNVPITSKGSGTIFDVTLAEVPPDDLDAGESCQITDISLPTGADPATITLPFTFNGTNPVTVYDSLPGNTTGNVTVVCDTINRNPFVDKVAVTAKTSASLTTPDLSDNHTTSTTPPVETCSLPGHANVQVAKTCKSVLIDPDDLTIQVCVEITLTNNSDPAEPLENITVKDSVLGTVLTGGTLAAPGAAGDSTTISGCYTPTSADQTGDPVTADNITFSDHVTEVSGEGSVTGDTFSLTAVPPLPSASCPLCPTP